MNDKQSGSALTIALVLVFSISIFAVASSGIVRSDFIASKKFKNSIKAGFLARAGFEQAVQLLRQDRNDFDSLNETWNENETLFKDVKLDDGYFSVGHSLKREKIFGIVDEDSKVNINIVDKEMLLLLPGLGRDEVERIIKARKQSLFYRPLDLVVRGIINEDLFISIKDLITVWGEGLLNVNTASREVLSVVPGLHTSEVDAIFNFRRGADRLEGTEDDGIFKTIIDLSSLSGIQFIDVAKIFKVASDQFHIISEGTVNIKSLSRGKKVIDVVVERKREKVTVKYWNMI